MKESKNNNIPSIVPKWFVFCLISIISVRLITMITTKERNKLIYQNMTAINTKLKVKRMLVPIPKNELDENSIVLNKYLILNPGEKWLLEMYIKDQEHKICKIHFPLSKVLIIHNNETKEIFINFTELKQLDWEDLINVRENSFNKIVMFLGRTKNIRMNLHVPKDWLEDKKDLHEIKHLRQEVKNK